MNNPVSAEVYLIIARLFLSLLFIISGLNHLLNLERMTAQVRKRRIPAPAMVVLMTGGAIIFGGITVLLGIWVKAGTLILTVFLLASAFILHNFWEKDNQQEKINEMNHFFKDVSLAGACIMIWYFGTGPLSLNS